VRIFHTRGHGLPQKGVDSGLISGTLSFQLGHDISVKPNGNGFLDRAVKLSNDGLAPVSHFGDIRSVDLADGQLQERS
jgi:hypothetical protein